MASLSKLGSILGIPIKTDRYTMEKARLKYARLLIEIPVDDTFPRYIEFVNDQEVVVRQQMEYEWKPIKCLHYRMYGQIEEECRKKAINRQEWRENSRGKRHTNAVPLSLRLRQELKANELTQRVSLLSPGKSYKIPNSIWGLFPLPITAMFGYHRIPRGGTPNKKYLVQRGYHWLLEGMEYKDLSKVVWARTVTPRHASTIWFFMHQKLPIKCRMARFSSQRVEVKCDICDEGEEDMDHLFFKCRWARDFRQAIHKWWPSPADTTNMSSFMHFTRKLRGLKREKMTTYTIIAAVIYQIWRTRNERLFLITSYQSKPSLSIHRTISHKGYLYLIGTHRNIINV
ncbi:hypothetical protein Cgig2_016815 [Carnegiea gigantea]|uniref:Reverse transcriptase zinc-binding domain-containing protein n=1 Tax=Carnegiea gigantea TaxID=171969 RepID=A0A9Q1GFD4_9CARY|nr:hypothetical protein Cgig2_016815 [Carnegiea gigantea]